MSAERRRRLGRRRQRRERARAVYLLPNLITSAALMFGFWSMVLAIHGRFDESALCIVLAGVCDMLDGRIARATNATSQFGVEYDSICDMVSFGVAPAMLMYNWTLIPLGPRAWMIAGLFALCAALRLARFNVQAAKEEDSYFYQGVPSTFAGGMVAATVWFVGLIGIEPPFERPLRLLLTISFAAMALLMVSPIRYPSLKLIKIEGRRAYPTLVAIVLGTTAILLNHELMIFSIGIVYIVAGPILAIYLARRASAEADLATPVETPEP